MFYLHVQSIKIKATVEFQIAPFLNYWNPSPKEESISLMLQINFLDDKLVLFREQS